MKRILHKIVLVIALCAAASSCVKKEAVDLSSGEGYLTLSLKSDVKVSAPARTNGASKSVDQEPYHVQIISSRGIVVQEYADHTLIPQQIKLKADTYTIRATQGSEIAAGFDHPFYVGEETAQVRSAESINAAITCRLGNVKVSVNFSPEIQANFSTYRTAVSNEESGVLVFEEGEARAGYLKSTGKLTYTLTLINNQGTEFSYMKTLRDVAPRDYHTFNFSIDSEGGVNNGGGNPNITVDETLNDKPHDIEVILNKKPKPTFTGEGFILNSPVNVLLATERACQVLIAAPASINSLMLTHQSEELTTLGIPMSINLVDADLDPELMATLNAAGLSWSSPLSEALTAQVNFTGLTSRLPLGTFPIQLSIMDGQSQLVHQPITFEVLPAMDVTTLNVNGWAKFAIFTGKWNTLERPEGIGFAYKKAADSEWISIAEDQLTVTGTEFSVQQALEPNTDYQVKAITATEENANILTFKTEDTNQIPFMNFDTWNKSGKHWYANADQGANFWWDSGNVGANTLSEQNPTAPEDNHLAVTGPGKRAGRLQAKVVFGKFAAGNIYTGQFGAVQGMSGATLNFGRPFTTRPTRFTGYYDYTSGTIDNAGGPYSHMKGQADICQIYVILTDWKTWFTVNTSKEIFINVDTDPGIIAYGSMETSTNTTGYQPFSIDIKYRSLTRKPTHVVLIASGSKYGDYFTGSTSSILYIDEFAFEYDAPVVMESGY